MGVLILTWGVVTWSTTEISGGVFCRFIICTWYAPTYAGAQWVHSACYTNSCAPMPVSTPRELWWNPVVSVDGLLACFLFAHQQVRLLGGEGFSLTAWLLKGMENGTLNSLFLPIPKTHPLSTTFACANIFSAIKWADLDLYIAQFMSTHV